MVDQVAPEDLMYGRPMKPSFEPTGNPFTDFYLEIKSNWKPWLVFILCIWVFAAYVMYKIPQERSRFRMMHEKAQGQAPEVKPKNFTVRDQPRKRNATPKSN